MALMSTAPSYVWLNIACVYVSIFLSVFDRFSRPDMLRKLRSNLTLLRHLADVCVYMCLCVCVCVCVLTCAKERERARCRDRLTDRDNRLLILSA